MEVTTIEKIERLERFADLRSEWNELLEASDSDCLFLTWEWIFTWWRHFSHGRRLFILAVRSRERLIALAPLGLCRRAAGGLHPIRTAEFLGTGSVGSDYLDVVVRRGSEAAALTALSDALPSRGVRLVLGQLRGSSSSAEKLAHRLERRGWLARKRPIDVCPYVNLASRTFDSYLASLGSSHRYNFRRRLRQLSRREFTFEQARDEEQRERALEALFTLHHKRWRGRGGSDALHTPKLRSFHRELSQRALERGWLRLFLLTLDGEPAAALYGFRYGRVFYFYQSGFEPRHAKHSVGLVMLGLSIQKAVEEGAEEYDLLHGDEAYKFHWASETRPLVRWELYPAHVTGIVYMGLIEAARAARDSMRRVLPDAGSVPAVSDAKSSDQHAARSR